MESLIGKSQWNKIRGTSHNKGLSQKWGKQSFTNQKAVIGNSQQK